jgi:hypothetical protein
MTGEASADIDIGTRTTKLLRDQSSSNTPVRSSKHSSDQGLGPRKPGDGASKTPHSLAEYAILVHPSGNSPAQHQTLATVSSSSGSRHRSSFGTTVSEHHSFKHVASPLVEGVEQQPTPPPQHTHHPSTSSASDITVIASMASDAKPQQHMAGTGTGFSIDTQPLVIDSPSSAAFDDLDLLKSSPVIRPIGKAVSCNLDFVNSR